MVRLNYTAALALIPMFIGGVVFSLPGVSIAQSGQVPAAFANAVSEGEKEKVEPVGQIKALTGVVSLRSAAGRSKFASEGTKLYVGDIVNTQKGSTAVLKFIDGTQVALRPSTRFVVEDYEFKSDDPVSDKAEFKLLKGGLRTLTGLISKRGNVDAFALKSETATIGIRGTDFSARLCEGDECDKTSSSEKDSVVATNTSTAGVAGRVSQVAGVLKARTPNGDLRDLQRGSPVFSGDAVLAGPDGFGVLTMADATRLTIPANSEMSIEAYRYAPAAPKGSVASFKLLKGAVRFVTGAIGKSQPDNVKFATETATIGIRGTSGDISCVPVASGAGTAVVSCAGGNVRVNVDMRSGSVLITTPKGSLRVNEGQSGFLLLGGLGVPTLSPVPLNTLQNVPNSGPVPENTPNNFEELSIGDLVDENGNAKKKGPRLFVSVSDGKIQVRNEGSDQQAEVSRGEGLYIFAVTGERPRFLRAPPRILATDKTLSQPSFTVEGKQCTPG